MYEVHSSPSMSHLFKVAFTYLNPHDHVTNKSKQEFSLSAHVLEQQKEQPHMDGFEEKLRVALASRTERNICIDYLRKLEPQFEGNLVRMVVKAMIEALTGPYAVQVIDLNSLYKKTDDALLFTLKTICNETLQAQYSTCIISRAEMCRFFDVKPAEIPFKLSRWLQRHKLETFGIIGMYRRPDPKEPTLIDTLVLLLTPEGIILQFNTEDDHLYKVCDVKQLGNMEVGIADDRRYHYAIKDYIDESICRINHTRGVIPYRKFTKSKILR